MPAWREATPHAREPISANADSHEDIDHSVEPVESRFTRDDHRFGRFVEGRQR